MPQYFLNKINEDIFFEEAEIGEIFSYNSQQYMSADVREIARKHGFGLEQLHIGTTEHNENGPFSFKITKVESYSEELDTSNYQTFFRNKHLGQVFTFSSLFSIEEVRGLALREGFYINHYIADTQMHRNKGDRVCMITSIVKPVDICGYIQNHLK